MELLRNFITNLRSLYETGHNGDMSMFAFYTIRESPPSSSTRKLSSLIGVSQSKDRGVTWLHLGTALSDGSSSLSHPWVSWDEESELWVMLPWMDPPLQRDPSDGSSALQIRDLFPWGRTRSYGPFSAHVPAAYTTGATEFPFGWRRAEAQRLSAAPPPSPSVKTAVREQWGYGNVPLLSSQAYKHGDRWWLFATERSYDAAWKWAWFSRRPIASYKLRLFHSRSLLGGSGWTEVCGPWCGKRCRDPSNYNVSPILFPLPLQLSSTSL